MGKRDDPKPAAPAAPFHEALAKLRERLPEGWKPPEDHAPPPQHPGKGVLPARAVVRLERKGRRGKEVTVVEKLALPAAALADWAEALKRALGCGGGVEGDAIAVQGNQRERVRRWLEDRGVRKVTMG